MLVCNSNINRVTIMPNTQNQHLYTRSRKEIIKMLEQFRLTWLCEDLFPTSDLFQTQHLGQTFCFCCFDNHLNVFCFFFLIFLIFFLFPFFCFSFL